MRSINILCIIAAVAALSAWPVAALADDEPAAATDDGPAAMADDGPAAATDDGPAAMADDGPGAAANEQVIASPEDVMEVMEFAPGRDGYLPKEGSYSPPWMGLVFGLLSVAVILATAFKSARRTHLD